MPEPGFYWIQTVDEQQWIPAKYTWYGEWYIIDLDEHTIPTLIGPRIQPPTS